jgi:L-ascorbate metabolism protein UlaG (beta-lactamase superfamily)
MKMDIQFYGANCVTLSYKQVRIVIDDNLEELGGKAVCRNDDIVLYGVSEHKMPGCEAKIIIDRPGEYEVAGVSVYGIAARAHMDEEGKKTATMYKIAVDDLNILSAGHIYPDLSDAQLESIGMIDVLLLPVGGNGYTLDGVGALKLIKKIEPKIIIPTHYDDPKLNFPVPQQTLEQALKALAMEPKETLSKLRVKPAELTETTAQLIVLQKP